MQAASSSMYDFDLQVSSTKNTWRWQHVFLNMEISPPLKCNKFLTNFTLLLFWGSALFLYFCKRVDVVAREIYISNAHQNSLQKRRRDFLRLDMERALDFFKNTAVSELRAFCVEVVSVRGW